MKKNIILYYVLSTLCLMGCADDMVTQTCNQTLPIQIASTYPVSGATRATDNGFVADDAVGIFVVDYNKDGTPGTPALKGNRASNAKFIYDGGTWSASYQLYWADGAKTPADFYGYYPYNEAMSSITAYPFSLANNQDSNATSSGYEASDLLWAKAEKVEPTADVVDLKYRHLMAGVTVALEMGSGFTASEWTELEKIVLIENTITDGTVDLSTGICTLGDGTPESIKPLYYNGVWRAVVFPQSVVAGKVLLNISVDGQNYSLVKDATTAFMSGKMHNFTITVNRSETTGDYTFALKADDIVAWVDDADMHDGLVRQYLLVEIETPGTLESKICSIVDDLQKINSLKVKGTINHQDLRFIGEKLTNITALNLRDVTITGGEGEKDVFSLYKPGNGMLAHIVFPNTIKSIADYALNAAGLVGTISIPEGVEYIGVESFCRNKLTGEIKLPSSLKILRCGAFAFNPLSGNLYLPDGLEVIGPRNYGGQNFSVFQECRLEGPLILPSSLKEYEGLGFSGTCGTLVIPQFMTIVSQFGGGGYDKVEFHDGITEIHSAFESSALSGELVLPPNLKIINGPAFRETKISKIIFPDNLRVMGDGIYNWGGTFSECHNLIGTLELPKNVARIPKACFYGCYSITGLVIPEGVDIIEENAFYGCNGINSIVCEDEEPPLVCEGAFFGVNKDNFTVEVPKGCVEKYKHAQGWSEFKRIAEYSNFVCRPAQANALNTAHTETLVLNADGAWTVEHCPDWVTLSATSGTGKTELRLTFNPMEHGAGNRCDSILFRMPTGDYSTYCVVSQYDYEQEEDSYLTLQEHTKGAGIDIVFVGDGFNGENISDGSYLELIKQQTEYFFGIEPYQSHREYFNVYVTFPLSQETGVNTMHTYVNNRFGTLYGYDGMKCTTDRLLAETDEVFNYAIDKTPLTKENLGRSMIILVPNSDAYNGVTEFKNGVPMAICPPSNRPYPQDTRGVIQHEAGGHGFGRLADEEIAKSAWPNSGVLKDIEGKQSLGWYQNIATTSNMKQVPWADFIFDTRYSDYVDVYEGAYGYMRGIFRSEANSCMNYGIPYYNAISRLSIMRRIKEYAGEWFTMDYFYEHDTNKWGDRDGITRAGTAHAYLTGASYAGSNQHVAPCLVDAKEQGDKVRQIREKLKKQRDSKKY
ncbi:MAG: fimbrillin family protein [Bacteroidaceae bacterium]|nr:fimbrillin family protein [Bacteroidaceae bacterium]